MYSLLNNLSLSPSFPLSLPCFFPPSLPPSQSFWVFIDPLVSDEMRLQLLALRNADSDVMKCRSWIRLMLSKSLILSFLEDLQRHPGLLASHYGGEAVIRDTERFEVIIQLIKGVSLFQFDCDYTSTRLEGWSSDVLKLSGISESVDGNSGKASPAQTKSPCMSMFVFVCVYIHNSYMTLVVVHSWQLMPCNSFVGP